MKNIILACIFSILFVSPASAHDHNDDAWQIGYLAGNIFVNALFGKTHHRGQYRQYDEYAEAQRQGYEEARRQHLEELRWQQEETRRQRLEAARLQGEMMYNNSHGYRRY